LSSPLVQINKNIKAATHSKASLRWILVILSLVVGLVATFSVIRILNYVDQHRQAEITLIRIEELANELNSLGWRAIAERELDQELTREVDKIYKQMDEQLNQLKHVGHSREDLRIVDEQYHMYIEVMNDPRWKQPRPLMY